MSAHTIEAVLTARDQSFSSTMEKAMGKTESFGQKLKSGLGFGAWMAIGQKAVGAVSNLISSSMDGAVKRFDTLNQFPKVMQSLGFGAKEAQASVDALAKGIEFLPTTLDAVSSQTQQFVAITGDIDKATKLTLALNNAMASGGAPAEQQASAINQWTQAMAKGKPDLQDWRALVQTAPAQMNQLAEATLGAGKTQSDLYDAMKNGTVTMDEVTDTMIKMSEEGGAGFESWAEQAKSAGAGIQMSIGNVKAGMQRNIANIIDGIDSMLSSVGGISGVIQGIIPAIDLVGETISSVLSGDMTVGEAIDSMASTISAKATALIPKGMELVGKLITGIGNALPTLITKGISLILDFISAIGQKLPSLIVTGLNAITNLINGLTQGQGSLASKAISIAGKILVAFIKALPQILKAGVNLMVALLRGLVSGFGSIPSKLAGLARKIPSAIKNGVGSLASIGRNLIEGLWGGISAKFNSVIEKVKAKAQALPKAVKKVLGIASPSKVMYKLGEYTGEGFALGIESMSRAVETASTGLAMIPTVSAMGASMEYEYGTTASFTVDVPLYVNGREFARATAGDMSSAINSRETRQSRLRGIR